MKGAGELGKFLPGSERVPRVLTMVRSGEGCDLSRVLSCWQERPTVPWEGSYTPLRCLLCPPWVLRQPIQRCPWAASFSPASQVALMLAGSLPPSWYSQDNFGLEFISLSKVLCRLSNISSLSECSVSSLSMLPVPCQKDLWGTCFNKAQVLCMLLFLPFCLVSAIMTKGGCMMPVVGGGLDTQKGPNQAQPQRPKQNLVFHYFFFFAFCIYIFSKVHNGKLKGTPFTLSDLGSFNICPQNVYIINLRLT